MIKTSFYVLLLLTLAALDAQAQDLKVRGGSNEILSAQNTSTQLADKVAVYGYSVPGPYYGIGGSFVGGYIGLKGSALTAGTGSRVGGWFQANYGTYNYGVWATASGSGSYAGYFNGDVNVTGTLTQASDAKLKTNIQPAAAMLPKVMSLAPKSYRYSRAAYPQLQLAEGEQIGLIAQEVAAVFPDFVHQVVQPPSPDSKETKGTEYLAVDYMALVPVLIKALQEQQAQIAALQAALAK